MKRNSIAIVGAAETTELGKLPGVGQTQLHADAALNALAYALLADRLRRWVGQPRVVSGLTRAGGATLIGMGIATAVLRRPA